MGSTKTQLCFFKISISNRIFAFININKALEYYQNLTKNHTNYVGTYYHLGKLLENLNQKQEALAIYQTGMDVARKAKDQHALNELMGVFNTLNDELEDI